jgi:isocitrate dehydrogenase (NAD+)
MFQVTLIPGDGVGAEITDSVKEVFEHVNAPIEWEQYDVSGMFSAGEDLFKQAMESLKRNRVGLKGTTNSPSGLAGVLRVEFLRHSLHSNLSVWSYFMERRHASTT